MRALLVRVDEMSIHKTAGVLDLTAAAIKEIMAKPKMASWIRLCGDALQDSLGVADRPVVCPTGQQGGGCNHWDCLAYRVWSVLVESQRACSEKFADPATLLSSQAANPSQTNSNHPECTRKER